MKKIILYLLIFVICIPIKSTNRDLEDAIDNSDTQKMLRLVAGNYKVTELEKAYYLKLAIAKSESAMLRVHNSSPKYSRTLLGLIPFLLGFGNFIYCGIKLFEFIRYPASAFGQPDENNEAAPKKEADSNKMARKFYGAGTVSSFILACFGAAEIYKGIVENNEYSLRENALAIEGIISRLQLHTNKHFGVKFGE